MPVILNNVITFLSFHCSCSSLKSQYYMGVDDREVVSFCLLSPVPLVATKLGRQG